ncbi:hypothetical protein LguiA_006415 [Lonicera macranthoides]
MSFHIEKPNARMSIMEEITSSRNCRFVIVFVGFKKKGPVREVSMKNEEGDSAFSPLAYN